MNSYYFRRQHWILCQQLSRDYSSVFNFKVLITQHTQGKYFLWKYKKIFYVEFMTLKFKINFKYKKKCLRLLRINYTGIKNVKIMKRMKDTCPKRSTKNYEAFKNLITSFINVRRLPTGGQHLLEFFIYFLYFSRCIAITKVDSLLPLKTGKYHLFLMFIKAIRKCLSCHKF